MTHEKQQISQIIILLLGSTSPISTWCSTKPPDGVQSLVISGSPQVHKKKFKDFFRTFKDPFPVFFKDLFRRLRACKVLLNSQC